MRNIITINSILDAYTCLSSTGEDENTIYFKCIVGEVISPKLKILLDGVQVDSVTLNINQSTLINITEYIPPTAGVLSVHYSDYDNMGTTYSIEFDNDRTGDLKLCELDETSFNAKYYSRTPSTGGTVSVEVNSTTTGEAGSEAQVTNSGDDVNVKLDFVIPKGKDGKDGTSPTVVNALTSTSTTNALSANQGRILKSYITDFIKTVGWQYGSVTINANSAFTLSPYDVSSHIPSGYKILDFKIGATGNGVFCYNELVRDAKNVQFQLQNCTDVSKTVNPYFVLTCIRDI